MTTSVERFDEKARGEFGKFGRTVVHEGEILRYPVYTRFLHWMVALSFVLALLSGLGIYSAWLYHWLTPLFGGGPMTRLLHPWFSLFFVVFFGLQFLNWLSHMTWTEADRKWMSTLRRYISNEDKLEPEYVGYFNAGQKLYFWLIAGSAVLLLLTGIFMWFSEVFGRVVVAISYVLHDVAALLMLGGFIIHVYQSTGSQPGTFESMTRGTVSEAWAWTHHPAWYREVTGRNPREDYEQARDRQAERRHAKMREQEAREQSPERGPTEPPTR